MTFTLPNIILNWILTAKFAKTNLYLLFNCIKQTSLWKFHCQKSKLWPFFKPGNSRFERCAVMAIAEIISDILLWTPSHGLAKAGWPARTYIQQLCANTGCSPEDLPEEMDDREGWQERVRDIHADAVTWWWWWWWWLEQKQSPSEKYKG